jgi:hypothetical protein
MSDGKEDEPQGLTKTSATDALTTQLAVTPFGRGAVRQDALSDLQLLESMLNLTDSRAPVRGAATPAAAASAFSQIWPQESRTAGGFYEEDEYDDFGAFGNDEFGPEYGASTEYGAGADRAPNLARQIEKLQTEVENVRDDLTDLRTELDKMRDEIRQQLEAVLAALSGRV